jgi:hypothetical protein
MQGGCKCLVSMAHITALGGSALQRYRPMSCSRHAAARVCSQQRCAGTFILCVRLDIYRLLTKLWCFIAESRARTAQCPMGGILLCPSLRLNPFQFFLLVFGAPRAHVRLGVLVLLHHWLCGR